MICIKIRLVYLLQTKTRGWVTIHRRHAHFKLSNRKTVQTSSNQRERTGSDEGGGLKRRRLTERKREHLDTESHATRGNLSRTGAQNKKF